MRAAIGSTVVRLVAVALLVGAALWPVERATSSFVITGTVDCGRDSGASCTVGPFLTLITDDLESPSQRVTLDINGVLSQFTPLVQDQLIGLEVEVSPDGSIEVQGVTFTTDGTTNPGLSSGSQRISESGRNRPGERDIAGSAPSPTPSAVTVTSGPFTTPTPTVPAVASPSSTATGDPTVSTLATTTSTATTTPSPTASPTITSTPSPTPTETSTPTLTPTETSTPTLTPTETSTPTLTPTETSTPTPTPTETSTPTLTPTVVVPTVQWVASAQSAGEGVGSVLVTAELSASTSVDVSVPFATSATGSTATATDDFSLSNSPLVITAGNLTASAVVTIVSDLIAEPDEVVVLEFGTPTNATSGTRTSHALTISDDDTAALDAVDDSYAVTGNVRIDVPAGSGLLTNDSAQGAQITHVNGVSYVAGTLLTLSSGAQLTVRADGSFSYDPPTGVTNASDGFTYRLTSGVIEDTASAAFSISDVVWFVDSDTNSPNACTAVCDGRRSHPFTSLATFRSVNDGAPSHPGDNDSIVLLESQTNYVGPLTLRSGQKLIGQDASESVDSITGITLAPHSLPFPATDSTNAAIVNIVSASDTLTLAQNNTIRGLTLGNAGTNALLGVDFGTLTLANGSGSQPADFAINTNTRAVHLTSLSSGTMTGAFRSISSSNSSGSAANSILLVGVGTIGEVDLGSGALSGANQETFRIDGGTGSFRYGGTITGNSSNRAVLIENKTAGTVTLAGKVVSDGTGVLLNNNSGAAIAFTGGLDLHTGSNRAFSAVNGGTVTVSQDNSAIINQLNTTTATALNVVNVEIGAAGLAFRSISSSDGSANGIVLVNTGSAGGLTVTGNGLPGSGGTIARKSGSDGSTANGSGIYLKDTAHVSLTAMQLNDFENFGIRGSGVTGLTLRNTVISAAQSAFNGSSSSASEPEGSAYFDGLTGTVLFEGMTIQGGLTNDLAIVNASGTLDFTMSASAISRSQSGPGNDGVLVVAASGGSAVLNVTIQDSTFVSARRDVFELSLPAGSQSHTLNFTGNAVSNGHPSILSERGGITLTGVAPNGQSHGNLSYTIANNNLRGALGNALSITKGSGTGSLSGTVSGNTIGVDDTPFSASREGSGIYVSAAGHGSHTVRIASNQVYGYAGAGIYLNGRDGSAALDVTAVSNKTEDGSGGGVLGFLANIGASANDSIAACLAIGGGGTLKNDFIEGDPANFKDMRISQSGAVTTRLPGYAGSAADVDQVAAFIRSNNLGDDTNLMIDIGVNSGYLGGAACQSP